MASNPITLHLLCGKIASGKSTLAAQLCQAESAVLISEDDWLAALYADQMCEPADYVKFSERLRFVLGAHVSDLLSAGVSVVLDFPANTRLVRDWMRNIIEKSGAEHVLHVLDVPDEVCLDRLHKRNAAADHPFAATEAQYWRFSSHFVMPSVEEGFNVQVHREAS